MARNIIGVAGEIASGTTTFASYAEKNFNASTYRFSKPLRDVVNIIKNTPLDHIHTARKRLYLPRGQNTWDKMFDCIENEFGENFVESMQEDRDTLQRLSTALRRTFGENCLAHTIFNDLQNDQSTLIVSEGARRHDDIEMLRKLPNFIFVYIDANFETRFNRVVSRKQYGDEVDITRDEFTVMCGQESESQIRDLKKYASVTIHNDDLPKESVQQGLKRYHTTIERVMLQLLSSNM